MKSAAIRLTAAALAVALPAAADAQCAPPGAAFDLPGTPFAFARLNGAVYDFSCLIVAVGDGTYGLSFGNNTTALASHSAGGSLARAFLSNYSITFDPTGVAGGAVSGSPSITWSVSTRTAVLPNTAVDPVFDFAFAFGMPVPTRRYATASATQGFSLANANARTDEGVSLTPDGAFAPLAPAPAGFPAALSGATGPLSRQAVYHQVLAGGVGATGIGAGTDPCLLADPNPAGRSRQRVCDFETGVQPLDATVGSLGLLVQYRQFGVLSVVTNGTLSVTPEVVPISSVPEPASLALTATGAVALLGGAAARRRRPERG